MLAGAALRKTGENWEFASEAALEDFIWDNLTQLLNLTPLARQHSELGEYCDILAINNQQQLTIIELKNSEDRHIIQQLTRYYDNLINAKPFAKRIDYQKPVRLIAIAPSFHRHNLIDCKYNLLDIELLQCAVIRNHDDFQLQLTDIDNNQIESITIPYQELELTASTNVTAPPQLLLDWLGTCTGEEQQAILNMRSQILSFDERIKEEIEGKKTIRYGRGKTKPIAELIYHRTTSKPVVFLWLPTPTSWRKEVIGRLRLWLDGSTVTYVGHIPEGFGRMKLQSEWDAMPREKRPKSMFHSGSSKSFTPVPIPQGYNNVSNTLESLVDLSLAKWLARI